MKTVEQLTDSSFSRTTFLKGSTALIVAFGVPLASVAGTARADSTPFPNIDPSQLDSWLTLGTDGTVTVFTGRNDSGQHKETSFAQIVADELDVPFSSVKMVMGDTARVVNQGSSTASDGLLDGGKPLRHAAAQARHVLLNLASAKLGVPAAQLTVSNGVVSEVGNSTQSVSYAALLGGQQFNTPMTVLGSGSTIDIQGNATVKDPSQYRLIGQSIPSVAIPHLVTAAWPRVQNIRLPGMLHARVVMPPVVSAHLVSVDGFRNRPTGLVKVVSKGDFLAVVTQEEWQAIEAMNFIKTTWTTPTPSLSGNGDVFNYLRTGPQTKPPSATAPTVGNVDAAIASAAKMVSAEYNYPLQSHGMIGPSCSVADVNGDQCTVWSGTQSPFGTQSSVAAILGFPLTSVRVISAEGSGAYGRMGIDDTAAASAYLSQQLGKPIRVQWMRQQEQEWEPVYPPSAFSFRAGVDSTGAIVGWDHQEYAWGSANGNDLPTMFITGQETLSGLSASFRPPGGGDVATYAFPNMRVLGNTVLQQLRGTAMRSPGRIQVNFAGEQFLDEIAAATGQDPIAIRIRHLANNTDTYTLTSIQPRMLAVLQTAQQVSGWQSRPSPGPGASSSDRVVTGRGIAIVASQRSSYVANVAEVQVDKKTGKVGINNMHVIVDAGQIVNPTGIKAQIEGATIYASSRALREEVVFNKSRVIDSDWITYPILRFMDVPQSIEITLIDQPTLSPAGSFANGGMGSYVNGGIGEPPNTVAPAAIGNAIFDATGVRVRQLPFSPERVRAALKAAGVA